MEIVGSKPGRRGLLVRRIWRLAARKRSAAPRPGGGKLVCTLGLTLATLALPATAQRVPPIQDETARFLTSYRQDLLKQDRAALAARYSHRGACFLGQGNKKQLTFEQIQALYAEQWKGPASFEWRDVSIEPLGPDAALVAARFEWGNAAGQPVRLFSYSGLLQREDGVLRIRLEDESSSPPPPAEKAGGG